MEIDFSHIETQKIKIKSLSKHCHCFAIFINKIKTMVPNFLSLLLPLEFILCKN